MTTYSLVAVYRLYGERNCLYLQGLHPMFLWFTVLTRKLRVTVGILVNLYQTTRCHIRVDSNLQSHSCQKLISHAFFNINFEMRKQKENFNFFLSFSLLIRCQLSIWNCCKSFFHCCITTIFNIIN